MFFIKQNLLQFFLLTVSIKCAVITQQFHKQKWQTSGKLQGDILIASPDDIPTNARGRNGFPNNERKWPNQTLIYQFYTTLTEKERQEIEAAFIDISSKTCIKFRRKSLTDRYYVTITNRKEGCYSEVGYRRRIQQLNLEFPGCHYRDTIVHEIIHTLGFFHMQSDPSRDEHVMVLLQNVIRGMESNFGKIGSLNSYGVEYDLDSIMHYDKFAFSKNDKPTLVAKTDANYPIGLASEMSEKDILKLNKMYEC